MFVRNESKICKLALAVMMSASAPTWAIEPGEIKNVQKNEFMYELGGSSLVSPSPNVAKVKLKLKAKAGLGYSCGSFDPSASISNGLNKLKSGVENSVNQVVGAATGAVASLPLYLLQRANPDLAGLLKEYVWDYQNKYQLELKSCEQREAEILAGDGSPYGDIVKMSQQAGIVEQVESGENDILEAAEETKSKGGCTKGVGGEDVACEKSTRPLNVTEDVTLSGYAIIANATPALGQEAQISSAASGTRLQAVLGSVDDAKQLALDVLGGAEFKNIDKGEPPEVVAGHGLNKEIEDEYEDVKEAVIEIVLNDGQEISEEAYRNASSPSINLRSSDFITIVKQYSMEERGVIAELLAWEIATSRVIEKALMLRRVLITGAQESNLYRISAVQKENDKMLMRLTEEIENLMFERKVRKELMTETVLAIFENYNRRVASGAAPSVGRDN